MTQFLKTKIEIEAWLVRMKINNYTLVADKTYGFIVNVGQSVNLMHENLHFIPVKFGEVQGGFFCGKNNLTSLLGSPDFVWGNFECQSNQLTSLEHAPKEVGFYFNCAHNQLTSLEGAPGQINSFNCSHNRLMNLKGCPKNVKNYFDCSFNDLNTLRYCPQNVGAEFYVAHNLSLGVVQEIERFFDIFHLHSQTLIEQEKKELRQILGDKNIKIKTKTQHKI